MINGEFVRDGVGGEGTSLATNKLVKATGRGGKRVPGGNDAAALIAQEKKCKRMMLHKLVGKCRASGHEIWSIMRSLARV